MSRLTLQVWFDVGVAMHPTELSSVRITIFFADNGPAV